MDNGRSEDNGNNREQPPLRWGVDLSAAMGNESSDAVETDVVLQKVYRPAGNGANGHQPSPAATSENPPEAGWAGRGPYANGNGANGHAALGQTATLAPPAANGNGNGNGNGHLDAATRVRQLRDGLRSAEPSQPPVAPPLVDGPVPVEAEVSSLAWGADAATLIDRVKRRAQQILEEAYESGSEIRLDALARVRDQMSQTDQHTTEILSRAQEEAAMIKAQALTEAQLALQRAQRDADGVIGGARKEADTIQQRAFEVAERIRQEAHRQAAEIVNSSNGSLDHASERWAEMQKLEEEFEATARNFARFLGMSPEQQSGFFKGLRKRKA